MKNSAWPEWVGILGAIALVTLMLRGWPNTIVFVEDYAAWVQAIGSIAAILASAGIAIGLHQAEQKSRRRSEMDAKLEMVRACSSAAKDTFLALNHFADKLEVRLSGGGKLRAERIEELRSTMRLLFSKDIPAGALEHLLVIQRELAYTVSDITNANNPKEYRMNNQEMMRKARVRPEVVKKSYEHLRRLHAQYRLAAKKTTGWRFRRRLKH